MNAKLIVGIGAQRAGTTWLAEYLTGHPQVGFSPIKELHYFDTVYRPDLCAGFLPILQEQLVELRSNPAQAANPGQLERLRCLTLRLEMESDERRYGEYFDLLARGDLVVVAEITPSYSLLKRDGFAAIRRVRPDARFLFVLRDPVDRYWSQLRYHETVFGAEAFDARRNAIECLSNPGFTLRSDYRRTLEELLSVVAREDVHLAFFEHLFDPRTTADELQGITDFMGIEPRAPGDLPRMNESGQMTIDPEAESAAGEFFGPVYCYVREVAGRPLPDRWLNTGL
ncbi:MAG: sulfotransferase [Opitutaceae bacterium]